MVSISLIIPTHNRKSALNNCLDAICLQNFPLEQLEVIVVADGCTDGTLEMLQKYEAPFTLKVFVEKGKGAAVARNAGAAQSQSPLFIFLDDDIIAEPEFVKAHYEAHLQIDNLVAIGYCPPVLQHQKGLFKAQLNEWWQTMFIHMQQHGYRYSYRNLLSGNFSIQAATFHKVNGFNPSFKCQEDYELGYRLIKAGAILRFVPGAIGYHFDITLLNRTIQRKYLEGKAAVQFCRTYPELLACYPSLTYFFRKKGIFHLLKKKVLFQSGKLYCIFYTLLNLTLSGLEKMNMRSHYFKTLDKYMFYAFLKGVVDSGFNIAELHKISSKASNEYSKKVTIDLKNGLLIAEQVLELSKPSTICIMYGNKLIGQVNGKPGDEPLRAIHLRFHLAKYFGENLYDAINENKEIDSLNRTQLSLNFLL
ncbi:MAG: glycosyltransferase [Flavobacterium sp.]|nr:MAG: glycosyltransferase [Flavobacterium sp.]